MSMAQQNQIDELKTKVQELAKQVQELSSLLKPASQDMLQPKRLGRPPKVQGHIKP